MTARAEFKKETKRLALKRSGGLCEAVGELYGLQPGQRCNAPLAYGVEFDHVILEANSHDNSLENCAATCKRCNQWKAANHDTPLAAKTVRQRDKLGLGIRKRSTMPGSRDSRWKKRMNGEVVLR
jgi:5-methylcytosine-specific restriction endonuclease McrA